jgi:tRNA (guanine26-N2/guanine27-N2)-dimethyltransferase
MKKTDFIKEGTTKILVFKKKISIKGPGAKEGVPFYNPSMEFNRDISILVCQWFLNNSKKTVKILDGLAASGIRGLRIENEVTGDFEVKINDWDSEAYELIKKNIKGRNIEAANQNLNTLLSEEKFDYIDIDPFGSPVYFIDSAIRSIRNNGIIAATATDTAALCGVYPKVCYRRYAAIPFHSNVMKEVGLRILIGYICREATRYDKGIEPILCYSTDHYFRVYVKIINGVNRANDSMNQFKTIFSEEPKSQKENIEIGPLWMGKLHNKESIKEQRTILSEKTLGTKNQLWKLFDIYEEEANAPAFFYSTEDLASHFRKSAPKMEDIFDKLGKKGFEAYRTHFSPTGFKTNASLNEIKRIFK